MNAPSSSSSRVVLITGASAGLGYAMALAFAQRGDQVVVTARRLDRLQSLVEDIKARVGDSAGQVLPLQADVTSATDMQHVAQEIQRSLGRLDVIIANAGLGQRGAIADSAWADLDAVLRTNLDGVVHTLQAGIPLMRQTGSGHIILISSVLSLAPGPYCAIYSASKAAINAIARGLRMELKADHIWVTNVLLGQTHTEFTLVRRGQAGRTASKMPTMQPGYVAERIVQLSYQRHRTVTLRWLDRLIMWAGLYLPWLTDRLLAKVYRPRS